MTSRRSLWAYVDDPNAGIALFGLSREHLAQECPYYRDVIETSISQTNELMPAWLVVLNDGHVAAGNTVIVQGQPTWWLMLRAALGGDEMGRGKL